MCIRIILVTFFYFLFFSSIFASQTDGIEEVAQEELKVTGFVFHIARPLKNVSILNISAKKGTITNIKGRYNLDVHIGDTLKFSHVGFLDEYRIIEKGRKIVNVNMEQLVEELDEVVVEKSKKLKVTQLEMEYQYDTNPNLIRSKFGILNKEISGYSMYVLDEGDFNSNAPDFLTAIQGKLPFRKAIGSMSTSASVVYELDGMVVSGIPPIPPSAIRRIAFIPGLSAVTLYGTLARDGIFIINTKFGSSSRRKKRPKEDTQIKGNEYQFDALPYTEQSNYLPAYLRVLYGSSSFLEAKEYLNRTTGDKYVSSYFVIESYNYIISRWKEKSFANKLLKGNEKLWENDVSAMKTLAYYMEMNGEFEEALNYYKQIFILRPQDLQSYRDLAAIYESSGNYRKASDIVLRYKDLVKKDFLRLGPNSIKTILDRDFDWYSKQMIKRTNLSTLKSTKDEFDGTRIIVEWNSSDLEFELQFVNPQGRYFKFDHSNLISENRISEEISYGYSCEEFLIDETSTGKWLINGKKLGYMNDDTPLYLKITIYENYGKNSQNKIVNVYRLQQTDLNVQMFQIDL